MPFQPHAKPPGAQEMLYLIAYDIADPRRLQRISEICQDYGTRVQYSLFECWLEDAHFQQLWEKLGHTIEPKKDRIVAYTLDKTAARKRRVAGKTMQLSHQQHFIIV